MSKYYSFGSCVVAVYHQCWCEGSAYQKQQGRASWDIYVTFTPRRGISPLRPSLLVPEPRLLLKLVTRIAAFPILESIGSVPGFKVKTSFFSFHQRKVSGRYGIPHLFGRGQGNALWGHRLWWAGSGDVGKPGRFASPTNYQAAWALRKVQRMFIAQFVHLVHAFTALWIAHTAFPGFGGQIQGKIWWQHIQIST